MHSIISVAALLVTLMASLASAQARLDGSCKLRGQMPPFCTNALRPLEATPALHPAIPGIPIYPSTIEAASTRFTTNTFTVSGETPHTTIDGMAIVGETQVVVVEEERIVAVGGKEASATLSRAQGGLWVIITSSLLGFAWFLS